MRWNMKILSMALTVAALTVHADFATAQECISLVPAVGDEDPRIVSAHNGLGIYAPELNVQPLNFPTFLGRWGTTRSRELALATYVGGSGDCPVLAIGEGNRLTPVQLNGPCAGEPFQGYMVDAATDRLGQHIAFTADFPVRPGLSANPGEPQVFLWSMSGDVITQITDGTATGTVGLRPSLAREGSLVAFAANGDLTGQNPDSSFEVFLRDMGTGRLTQVTDGAGCDSGTIGKKGVGPSISEDGTRIAFVSNCDLTGGNPQGLQTVFLADLKLGATIQLAHCPGCTIADLPAISRDGSTVLNYDISSLGSALVIRLMVHTIGSGSATTRSLCQPISSGPLTLGEAAVLFSPFNTPAVTENGHRIAFAMEGNPTGANPTGFFEVFVMDLAADLRSGKVRQITDGTDQGGSFGLALDWKGSRLWTWGTFRGLSHGSQEILRVSLREP
jgi:hypothetical protein